MPLQSAVERRGNFEIVFATCLGKRDKPAVTCLGKKGRESEKKT